MIYTTVDGTKFEIDLEAKTWKRIDKTGDYGNLRTEEGTFTSVLGDGVGSSLQLLCPPFKEGTFARMIMTQPIKTIEE